MGPGIRGGENYSKALDRGPRSPNESFFAVLEFCVSRMGNYGSYVDIAC